MTTGYFTKRSFKQIDQNFKRIGKTSIENFIEQNFSKEKDLDNNYYSLPIRRKYLEYMNDRGDGRISKGLRSLEFITKTFRGIPQGALVLFDQIIYSNPYNFKTMNIEDSRIVIVQNLGLSEFIPNASLESKQTIDQLYNMIDRIFKDMKNFTYTFDRYLNEALPRCKLVVKASLNYNNGNG